MEEVYPRQPIGKTEDSLGPISDISPDFSQRDCHNELRLVYEPVRPQCLRAGW